MTRIFHRSTQYELPVATRGQGPYVIDDQGNRYFDASGGAAVSCLGHDHPAPVNAIKEQVGQLAYIHSGFFTSDVSEKLGEKLISMTPDGLERAVFLSGGSEAMEAAIKLARQYFVETDQSTRTKIIARRRSYHGNTLGVLGVGQSATRKIPYLPILKKFDSISPCYPYRDKKSDESDEQYGLRVANELEEKLQELGPENVIAFVAETVSGASLGVQPPVNGYLKRIREICDQNGILLILDEVMCGTGRTGTLLSCVQDEVTPDITAIAKGLGAGYQPIAATICTDEIYSTVKKGSGVLGSGFTYMGHATACAASLAVLETIDKENLLENVRVQGKYMINQLRNQLDGNPNIGDIRGRGLFIGIEFVADRETKEPLDPAIGFHKVLKNVAFENGLLIYPGGGTIDGVYGDHVLLAPPYIVNQANVDELVDKLKLSIEGTIKRCNINSS